MPEVYKRVGRTLRRHRRLAKLTQSTVAKKLGYTDAAVISKWERGVCLPNSENLIRLSVLYKTLANQLLYPLAQEFQKKLTEAECKCNDP